MSREWVEQVFNNGPEAIAFGKATFQLHVTPISKSQTVFLNGMFQTEGVDYDLSGPVLSMRANIHKDDLVVIRYERKI